MITIDELKSRFGPVLDVAPWGECVVILESQFSFEWEKELFKQGYVCHFEDLDKFPAVFIPLKKAGGV